MKIERTHLKYLASDDVDAVARQNAQLMAELWIVKDRLALIETMLEEKNLIDRKTLNDIEPEGELADELRREREAYIDRIMGIDPKDRTVEALRDMAPNRK